MAEISPAGKPHRVHVAQGPEYAGETYIWCECLTGEGDFIQTGWHNDSPDGGLFEGDGLPALLEFLQAHGVTSVF